MRKLIPILICLSLALSQNCTKDQNNASYEKVQIGGTLQKSTEDKFFSIDYITTVNSNILGKNQVIKNIESRSDSLLFKSESIDDNSIPFIQSIREYYMNHPTKWYYVHNKLGFPIWNFARQHYLNGKEVIIIPVTKEDSYFTEAIMLFYRDNNKTNILFHYIKRGQFENYPVSNQKIKTVDRSFIMGLFIIFDKIIFEYADCELIKKWAIASSFLEGDSKNYSICNVLTEPYLDCSYWLCVGTVENPYIYCNYYCQVEYDIYIVCNDIGGSGSDPIINTGGGGTSIPTATEQFPLKPFQTPCEQIRITNLDGHFSSKFSMLKSHTQQNHESMFILKPSINNLQNDMFSYEYYQGAQGETSMNFSYSGSIVGMIHSHFTGCLKIFSFDDIKALYDSYIDGNLLNLETATWGVINPNGGVYLLKVENPALFLSFSHEAFDSDVAFNAFSTAYSNFVNTTMTDSECESNFINFCNLMNTGLTLVRGNYSTCSNWQIREKTGTSVTNKECFTLVEE